MKKICWISDASFIDTDLPVINKLQCNYIIKYIFITHYGNTINNEQRVWDILGKTTGVKVEFVYLKQRGRSFKNISQYYRIIKSAKSFHPDLYYISFQGFPYAWPMYRFLLPNKKCVVPCHNVSTPKGANSERMAPVITGLWVRMFRNFHILSECQMDLFKMKYPNKNAFTAPFLPMYYGEPTEHVLDSKTIRFLFFGNIVRYKRVDLLIKATNILVERGFKNFNVTIAGGCRNWDDYVSLIKYPQYMDLKIRRIPDEEIANLFAKTHYFVMPYQDIAQSGVLFIALTYNRPTILSDIPQFNEFVIDNQTSLSFKSEDAESLADIMQYAIKNHESIYSALCNNQKVFFENNFSDKAIVNKYIDFFESL